MEHVQVGRGRQGRNAARAEKTTDVVRRLTIGYWGEPEQEEIRSSIAGMPPLSKDEVWGQFLWLLGCTRNWWEFPGRGSPLGPSLSNRHVLQSHPHLRRGRVYCLVGFNDRWFSMTTLINVDFLILIHMIQWLEWLGWSPWLNLNQCGQPNAIKLQMGDYIYHLFFCVFLGMVNYFFATPRYIDS